MSYFILIYFYCAIISRLYPEVNLTYFNDDNLNTGTREFNHELNLNKFVFINKTTLNILKILQKYSDVLKRKYSNNNKRLTMLL